MHFIEASATALSAGGYEIFILMEYCSGGGIIDLMNAHLRDRLSEDQVLHIFADVCQGLAVMHHLHPPLLHRDLKIENVLISPAPADDPNRGAIYKLADFGSAAPLLSRHAPKSLEEIKRVEDDLNRATTLQYRAPEMVDLYQRRVIDEKADIWAMGVFLYKLCYFITPFEENGGGSLAILNARFRFPPSPAYSPKVKALIASMLKERAEERPTVDQLIVRSFELRGLHPPSLAKKYVHLALEGKQMPSVPTAMPMPQPQTRPGSPKGERPVRLPKSSAKPNGTTRVVQVGSDVVQDDDLAALRNSVRPMRRGRPVKSPSHHPNGVPDDSSPKTEAIWPGMGTAQLYPTSNGFGDSFTPTPPSATAGRSSDSPVVRSPIFDDATTRFPSLEELDATPLTATSAAPSKASMPVPDKTSSASASSAVPPTQPTHASMGSIKDRWPPLRDEDAYKVAKARSHLAVQPEGEAPALPRRSAALQPITLTGTSSHMRHTRSTRVGDSKPPLQSLTQTKQEPEAPARDWLTGSEDQVVDTIQLPLTARSRQRTPQPPRDEVDESSDDERQPEAADGNPYARREVGKVSLPAWVETPSTPVRTSAELQQPGDDASARASGLQREHSFDLGMQPEDELDLALIEGRIPSTATPSFAGSAAVAPTPPMSAPLAQPEDEIDLALIEGRGLTQPAAPTVPSDHAPPPIISPIAQPEDEMDLALIEGRVSEPIALDRPSSATPSNPVERRPQRAEASAGGLDYGDNPPIKAPSWDEDLPSPRDKLVPPMQPTPSPRLTSPAQHITGTGKLGEIPRLHTGAGAGRTSLPVNVEDAPGKQTRPRVSPRHTGIAPLSPPRSTVGSTLRSQANSSPSLAAQGMPSLQDRMRDLQLSKASVAAKFDAPAAQEPARVSTTTTGTGKQHARPISQSISISSARASAASAGPSRANSLNIKPGAWRAKPLSNAQASGEGEGKGGAISRRPPAAARMKPWEREALAAQAIQHGGVVRSDMRLLDGGVDEAAPGSPEADPAHEEGFKGVNRLISRWQQVGR